MKWLGDPVAQLKGTHKSSLSKGVYACLTIGLISSD